MSKYVRGHKYFIDVDSYSHLPNHVPLGDREIKNLLFSDSTILVSPEVVKSELKKLGYDSKYVDGIVDNIQVGYILDTDKIELVHKF